MEVDPRTDESRLADRYFAIPRHLSRASAMRISTGGGGRRCSWRVLHKLVKARQGETS